MSMKLDAALANTGTKFKIFAQPPFLSGFAEPETVWLSVPRGEVSPGPGDDRMYVTDALNKSPYGYPYLPPHTGPARPAVQPSEEGHFDHLDVDSRDFKSAHMYAVVRRVLDIWEDYLGKTIEWHFAISFEKMELIPLIAWDNAHSGYGFLEFGYGRTLDGSLNLSRPYCLNFDVLAHELGHSLIFAEVGFPNEASRTEEYGGFHESCGDLVALVASLHFNLVVDKLLATSKGNLFTVNELARIGELSDVRQIRNAFNYERMSTVTSEPHDLSRPLTGAVFDVFVEVFQKHLVDAGLISQELADRSYHGPDEDLDDDAIQQEFAALYDQRPDEFKVALLMARDYLGALLAGTWDSVSPHFLTYADVGKAMLSVDRTLTDGAHHSTIRECFAWREIGVEPGSMALQSWRISDCAKGAAGNHGGSS